MEHYSSNQDLAYDNLMSVLREPLEPAFARDTRQRDKGQALAAFGAASALFATNPSATNWRTLETAMHALQDATH